MTAPVAIGAAVSPPDVNATTAGKLVGSFGDVLARAQCQKAIQVAGHGESEKAKQTSGDDELANKEIAATTGTALPPNLILCPMLPSQFPHRSPICNLWFS